MAEMREPTEPVAGESLTVLSEALEQIHLDKAKLPAELRDSFDLQELKDALPNAKSLSILVSGKTGVGKSCLVNGIIGKTVAEEGDKVIRDGKTSELRHYTRNVDGVDVTVWDSPGLQDGTDNQAQTSCISKMRDKCSTADLALYCIKMVETRFIRGRTDNPDVNAMARITETFGPNFWRNTIVVLTFANIVEAMKVGWRKLDAAAKEREFQKELQNWEKIIQDVLMNEINVPREIATTVLVVPAGHYVDIQLPDRDYWLSMLWFHCLEAIATPEGRVALVRINARRIMQQNQVQEKDFDQPLPDQPLVVEGFTKKEKGLAALFVFADTLAGAGLGAKLVGTGVAIGAGAASGFVIGALVAVLAGAVIKWRRAASASEAKKTA